MGTSCRALHAHDSRTSSRRAERRRAGNAYARGIPVLSRLLTAYVRRLPSTTRPAPWPVREDFPAAAGRYWSSGWERWWRLADARARFCCLVATASCAGSKLAS